MKFPRYLSPLLFAFVLLFAQQGSMLHALQHVFAEQTQQQNKKIHTAHDCEQCTTYAQLGSALNSDSLAYNFGASIVEPLIQKSPVFSTRHTLAATARGPPTIQISA